MNVLRNQEIWQQLLWLESRDIVQKNFKEIHSTELNNRRAREINSAAKQAREYFNNASRSDYSVRPLLTFYGVASLSRSLLLLLKTKGGEEGLKSGHGLETVSWKNVLAGNTSEGLAKLGKLQIRKRDGLFSDFVVYTKNRLCVHLKSAGVDWRITYGHVDSEEVVSVSDLFSRIPDLEKDFRVVSSTQKYAGVIEMSYRSGIGLHARVGEKAFSAFEATYERLGYKVESSSKGKRDISCDVQTLVHEFPLLVHSYMHKMFDTIPRLYIAEPFPSGARYSQLCMTYMVSYVLGMLVRYFPTHWISLIQGTKGDRMWPTINRAQRFVEYSFPELVAEFANDMVENPTKWTE